MRAIGTVAAAAALLALGGCDQLGIGTKAESNEAANAAATNSTAAKPAGEQAAADPGSGLGGKDQAGAIQAGSGTAGGPVDRGYVIGRWTDDEDCDNAIDLFADGRFTAANGNDGLWNLAGDRLTLQGDRVITVQIVPIDQNSMTVVNADGSLGRSTRC